MHFYLGGLLWVRARVEGWGQTRNSIVSDGTHTKRISWIRLEDYSLQKHCPMLRSSVKVILMKKGSEHLRQTLIFCTT